MPMPLVMDSDRKKLQVGTVAVWRIKVTGTTIAVGKYIKINYGDTEVIFNTTTTAGSDIGTDCWVDPGNAVNSGVYLQRNYFINRDFTVSSFVFLGNTYFQFTANYPGAAYNATVVSDDSNISFISNTVGVDATPNPNFAYLVDIYVQKINADDATTEPYEKIQTITLAPNTDTSEVDLAPELLPYTQPAPPTPYPGTGFSQPEYMRSQALRYRVIYSEVYGTTPVPQIADDVYAGVAFIDANIAIRGGIRKNLQAYIFDESVGISTGTALMFDNEKLWLTSFSRAFMRRVSPRQYQWLTILATGALDGAVVKVKYFNSATGGTEYNLFTISWPTDRTSADAVQLRIPVGLPTILPIHSPSFAFNKYEIRIADPDDGTDIYPAVAFYVEPEHIYERFLIFENSLGGWESWRFIGGRVNFAEVTGEVYTKLNDLFNDYKHTPETGNHSTLLQEEMELNSGPLKSIDEVYWLVELLISECIYFHNYFNQHNDYYRITRVPGTFQLHQDDNNHYYINLKVRKAWQDTTYGFIPEI